MKVCPKCGSYKLTQQTLLQKLYTGTVYGAECDICGGFTHYEKVPEEAFKESSKVEE